MGKKNGNDGGVVVTPVPKEGSFDTATRVKVKMNENAPHHKDGQVTEMSPVVAAKVEANNWGKILGMIALLMFFAFGMQAQNVNTFYQPLGTLLTSDTVTNSATAYLTSRAQTRVGVLYTTIQVVATEISGTTGGTITLQGSLDGVNYKAALVLEDTTAVPAYTATDVASQTFIWRLYGNPYTYYRISWTGTGTMSDKFTGKIYQH